MKVATFHAKSQGSVLAWVNVKLKIGLGSFLIGFVSLGVNVSFNISIRLSVQ